MIDLFTARQQVFMDTITEALGTHPRVVYAAYKTDSNDLPINNLHETAIQGDVIFQLNDHTTGVINSPTWLDVALHADYMLRLIDDHHHVFLESVFPVQVAGINHYQTKTINGIDVYSFNMGS